MVLTPHLRDLESESIEILREVAAEFDNPVLLYSIGKDSSVLPHLAKAFSPRKPPFPLLHIDTTWKFREMIASRVMKTEALKQALERWGFDAAIDGARRDEEKSRAKERIFSLRRPGQAWDPRGQRPELWRLWNPRLGPGESMRVFPLSNWTELDVWRYVAAERIPVVPLYFARPRPVVARQRTLIVVDDDRLPLEPGERPEIRRVRFRTLGCYPPTGAIESEAASVEEIIAEMELSRASERQGRLIDADEPAAMERKKKEGYF